MPWFEDIAVGRKRRFGRYEVTREEVIGFARKYDAQPFHLSDEAAAATPFGRMAASGWHTGAMTMAMTVAAMEGGMEGNLGAAGVEHSRWPKPVYPGDVLSVETEVLEARRSRTRPIGIVRMRVTVLNQQDEPVMTFEPIVMHKRRDG